MLEMPVIGAKVPSKRRPPMPMGGSPKPPAFPPPGIKLLPLKAKACSRNKSWGPSRRRARRPRGCSKKNR